MKINKNHLEFFWVVFVTGLVISFFVEDIKLLLHDPIYLISVLYCLALSAIYSFGKWLELSKEELDQEEMQLKNEYKLIKETKYIIPEDLSFKVMRPDEILRNSERPYFNTYINRHAIPYESSSVNITLYTEQDLTTLFEQGNSILLIGNPTEGKTRTLLEVIRELKSFFVICLRIDRSPSNNALELLKGKKVLWLLDDLNTYDSDAYDFHYIFNFLKKISSLFVLAATCRDGPELKAVNINTGQLHKIYDLFDYKFTLKPASDYQKNELKHAIGETNNRLFPTLGSICMLKHFEFMRERFRQFTELEKNSFRAIFLLFSGFIYPFTLQRIKAILTDVLEHKIHNIDDPAIRTSLNILAANGFVIYSEDENVIVPDAAYITGPESAFYYPKNRSLQNDYVKLAECFKKHKDADGLSKLAFSQYSNGDIVSALIIWEDVINEFKDSEEISILEHVANALFIKGFMLDQMGKYLDAIKCYDTLVKRFGNSQELALQIMIAKALFNQGCANHWLKEYEEEIKCYDDLIQRFSTSDVLELKIQVANAFFNKSNCLYKLGKPEDAQICLDATTRCFVQTKE